jgi:hypothetical protein
MEKDKIKFISYSILGVGLHCSLNKGSEDPMANPETGMKV